MKKCVEMYVSDLERENWIPNRPRHLDVSNCVKFTHMPLGLGHLISLDILPLFFVRQKARSGGGQSELKWLSNLRGRLEIKYLGDGRDDMAKCKATYMKGKLTTSSYNRLFCSKQNPSLRTFGFSIDW